MSNTNEFTELVKQWLALDDQIKEIQRMKNDRTKKKRKLEVLIVNYMDQNNISRMNTKKGRLSKEVSEKKKPISSETIKMRLANHFKDPQTAIKFYEYLYHKPEIKEKVSLKRETEQRSNSLKEVKKVERTVEVIDEWN